MKCQLCSSEFPEPDIVEGTAYFVCSSCGHVHEIQNYRIHTKEEWGEIFKVEFGFVLPDEYINLAGQTGPWIAKLPHCDNEKAEYYFGDGYYVVDSFADLNPYRHLSIFESPGLIKEWSLPRDIVLIEGNGHVWLALDYRDNNKEPKVIVIESDEGESLMVAENFGEFISSLKSYDEALDTKGNPIDDKQFT